METCRWIPEAGNGIEHLTLRRDGAGLFAQGAVIGDDFGAFYTIRCDSAWRVRQALVEVAGGARLELHADGAGHWQDGQGVSIPALAGCIDIDLTASCFTNSLPIRRLGAALAIRQEIDVAWVHLPALHVEPARQAYTRLASHLYRFEGVDTGFMADLTVDDEGLVVHYPGLFHRTD